MEGEGCKRGREREREKEEREMEREREREREEKDVGLGCKSVKPQPKPLFPHPELHSGALQYLFPNQQRTLSKLLTELRRRNFVNKHRLSIQIGAKRAKKRVCNAYVF